MTTELPEPHLNSYEAPAIFQDLPEYYEMPQGVLSRDFFEISIKGMPKCKIVMDSEYSELIKILSNSFSTLISIYGDTIAFGRIDLLFKPHTNEISLKCPYMDLKQLKKFMEQNDPNTR